MVIVLNGDQVINQIKATAFKAHQLRNDVKRFLLKYGNALPEKIIWKMQSIIRQCKLYDSFDINQLTLSHNYTVKDLDQLSYEERDIFRRLKQNIHKRQEQITDKSITQKALLKEPESDNHVNNRN